MTDVIDVPADIKLAPIEIERCEQCGCAIEDLEELIYLRAADLIAQWECADPRDCWRHTGEQPRRAIQPPKRPEPYRPAESVIAAFQYVVSLNDLERLKDWLADHPADAPTLLKLLESK